VCPVGQMATYADKGRQSLYNKKSYKTASEHAEHSTSTRNYSVPSKSYRVRPLVSSDWTPTSRRCPVIDARGPGPSESATSIRSAPSSSGAQTSTLPRNGLSEPSGGSWQEAPTNTSPKPPKPQKQSKPASKTNPMHGGREDFDADRQSRPYREDRDRQSAGAAFNSMVNNGDSGGDAVAAAVDVAKDVTKALGKSLLSFASFSLKAVGEAAAVAQGTYQSHTNPTVQVGDMSVTIARELAEGGFGTVYLVQVQNHQLNIVRRYI
jgi:hypothetical protein